RTLAERAPSVSQRSIGETFQQEGACLDLDRPANVLELDVVSGPRNAGTGGFAQRAGVDKPSIVRKCLREILVSLEVIEAAGQIIQDAGIELQVAGTCMS